MSKEVGTGGRFDIFLDSDMSVVAGGQSMLQHCSPGTTSIKFWVFFTTLVSIKTKVIVTKLTSVLHFHKYVYLAR